MSKQNMLITEDQYWSLTPMGRELHDYWMNHKTAMYQDLHRSGKLWEMLDSENHRLDEMVIDLIHSGLAVDQAKEVARAEIYGDLTE